MRNNAVYIVMYLCKIIYSLWSVTIILMTYKWDSEINHWHVKRLSWVEYKSVSQISTMFYFFKCWSRSNFKTEMQIIYLITADKMIDVVVVYYVIISFVQVIVVTSRQILFVGAFSRAVRGSADFSLIKWRTLFQQLIVIYAWSDHLF